MRSHKFSCYCQSSRSSSQSGSLFNIAKFLATVCEAAQTKTSIVLEPLIPGKLSLAKHAIEHRERRRRAELLIKAGLFLVEWIVDYF